MTLLPAPALAKPGMASWPLCSAGGLDKTGRLGEQNRGALVAPHILQCVVSKSPAGGEQGLALLPAAGGGCPGMGTAWPAGFIYKQAGAGTGQPGTSGTQRPIMLIITT